MILPSPFSTQRRITMSVVPAAPVRRATRRPQCPQQRVPKATSSKRASTPNRRTTRSHKGLKKPAKKAKSALKQILAEEAATLRQRNQDKIKRWEELSRDIETCLERDHDNKKVLSKFLSEVKRDRLWEAGGYPS